MQLTIQGTRHRSAPCAEGKAAANPTFLVLVFITTIIKSVPYRIFRKLPI
jgi:hypothetical protein